MSRSAFVMLVTLVTQLSAALCAACAKVLPARYLLVEPLSGKVVRLEPILITSSVNRKSGFRTAATTLPEPLTGSVAENDNIRLQGEGSTLELRGHLLDPLAAAQPDFTGSG